MSRSLHSWSPAKRTTPPWCVKPHFLLAGHSNHLLLATREDLHPFFVSFRCFCPTLAPGFWDLPRSSYLAPGIRYPHGQWEKYAEGTLATLLPWSRDRISLAFINVHIMPPQIWLPRLCCGQRTTRAAKHQGHFLENSWFYCIDI